MEKTKQFSISEIMNNVTKEKEFHLTVKDGYRRIHLGRYKSQEEVNAQLEKAKTNFDEFYNNLLLKNKRGKNYYFKNNEKNNWANQYEAYINKNNKRIYLGSWKTEEEAIEIVDLAKRDLEAALVKVEKNSLKYFENKRGKNYYRSGNGFQVAIKRGAGAVNKVKWYWLGTYKTEIEAQAIVSAFYSYEKENGTLEGVEDYIKKNKLEIIKAIKNEE